MSREATAAVPLNLNGDSLIPDGVSVGVMGGDESLDGREWFGFGKHLDEKCFVDLQLCWLFCGV